MYIWVLILGLVVLHQDFWFWNDATVVGGLMPIGLVYHACLSVAASLVWLIAVRFAWPKDVDVGLHETESVADQVRNGGPQS